jgi:predicted AlkP superfamily phosphohydrolase/phosphomutase
MGQASAVSASCAKVILIGLDAADRCLVEQWCDSGDLPNLRLLRDRGAYGHLTSPPALGDDATWASFYTGVSPGRHGRYFWKYLDPGRYDSPLSRDGTWPEQPFWSVLSRAGRRVAVLDVPKCPLVAGLNGIQLADWQVHGRDGPGTRSWPPELAETVLSRYGDDRTDSPGKDWMCMLHSLPQERIADFRSRLLEGLRQKTRLTLEILEQEGWDLFLVVFKEAHCIGHQCWHLMDAAGNANPVKEIYRELDCAIGEIVSRAGPDTSVIVFSDLGMASNDTGEHLLDEILRRLESAVATPRQRMALAARRVKRRLRSIAQSQVDESLHLAERLAYRVDHNEMSGAIRINLVGREPAGIVFPGAEYNELCRSLRTELLALRDPVTGQALVESVLSTRDSYPGALQDRLPDLFAVWARHGSITGAVSASIGELRAPSPGYRTGNHLPGGFYIGVGPHVAPGRHARPASIMDLAPTAAWLLQTSLADREGRPVRELCGG